METFPEKSQTVFVTKYALTQGIRTVIVDQVSENGYLYYKADGYTQQVHMNDWFLTYQEAKNRVLDKIQAKLDSLHEQEIKLQTFRTKLIKGIVTMGSI